MESLLALPTHLFEEFTSISVPNIKLNLATFSEVGASNSCHRWLRLTHHSNDHGPVAELGLYPCKHTATVRAPRTHLLQVIVRFPKPAEKDALMIGEYVVDLHISGLTKPGTPINWQELDLAPFRKMKAGKIFVRTMTALLQRRG